MSNNLSVVLDSQKMQRALTRIAHEILERNSGPESLIIIGILTRGALLAKRIAGIIKELEGVKIPLGFMDISLYRDDVHSKLEQPIVQRTDILFEVRDKNVILIDDVLYTGRTVRAALDQMVDFGRARTIQLAVLVDRGHRELPIKPDYVGANIPTSREDRVVVKVAEQDGSDEVLIEKGKPESQTAATPKKSLLVKKAKGKK
ncbi:MAG TPA: bifunctional pyr operon transcriptional regulator/uracil phosphoribosyltransferase PyrR [candidate division Zixibacteria bacterium]|nr:bifunctional pyr operon transcriptional regulator/uracil phosphoribosyltransferase PyrR [candidate division Zixibacteria bacterium]